MKDGRPRTGGAARFPSPYSGNQTGTERKTSMSSLAEQRAKRLLLSQLSPEQAHHLAAHGSFSDGQFTFSVATWGVSVTSRGYDCCIGSNDETLPICDQVLALLLFARVAPGRFWEIANSCDYWPIYPMAGGVV